MPTLSICIPNYNHARFLPAALDSIGAQTFQPLEVIVVDDASTDASLAVLEEYARRMPTLRVLRNERNRGAVASMGTLLEQAKGDYWFGVAADDRLLPGILEQSMRLLTRFPDAGLCSTLTRVIDEEGVNGGVLFGNPFHESRPRYFSPEEARRILVRRGSWIQGNTTIYRRDALLAAGGFLPELRSFCDGFVQQVIALRCGACFIPEPLAEWRRMGDGYAYRSRAAVEDELRLIETVVALMDDTYADTFPPGYSGLWREQSIFDWARLARRHATGELRGLAADLRRLGVSRGVRARVSLRLLERVDPRHSRLVTALLLAALLPRQVFTRRISYLLDRWRSGDDE